MKAVILAAGRGSRLRQLTEERPKCLVPLAGRPLIEWQIEALKAAGVSDIAAVCGYRASQLSGYPVDLIGNPDWETTSIASSLAKARNWLAGSGGIVSYSDIVYSTATIRALLRGAGDITIVYDRNWRSLWERRMSEPLDDVENFRLRADGSIAAIGGRPTSLEKIEGQYMGLLRFTPDGWDSVIGQFDLLGPDKGRSIDMTSLLSTLIGGGKRVDATPAPEAWMEIDTESDLRLCEAMIASGELPLSGELARGTDGQRFAAS